MLPLARTLSPLVIPAAVVAAVGGGSPGATAAITSTPGGALRNNFGDYVGCKFTVGAADLFVKSMGRWKFSGNSAVHTVKIADSGGSDIGSVFVDLSGGSAGSYVYAILSSVLHLVAGASYYLVSLESSGGDQWGDLSGVTTTADLTVNAAAFYSGGYNPVGTGSDSYVNPNFLYDLTP